MYTFDSEQQLEQHQSAIVHPSIQPQPQYVYVRAGRPSTSLIFGILGLVAWIMPIAGLPLTIVGIIYGKPDVYGNGRVTARVGKILCIIGLCLTVVNMAAGAYLAMMGQHPLIRDYNPSLEPPVIQEMIP